MAPLTGNTVPQTGSTPLTVAGVLGEAVTLPLQLSAGRETESVTWLHNGTSIVFIQVNQVGSPQIMVTDPRRKDRLQVTQTHSLQLSNLMMADVRTHHILITTKTSILLSDYTPRSFNARAAAHTYCPVTWLLLGKGLLLLLLLGALGI
ncbi:SLAM family member 6 [Manis javanica]|nr:SLAM family member 6 [Manis javanica]